MTSARYEMPAVRLKWATRDRLQQLWRVEIERRAEIDSLGANGSAGWIQLRPRVFVRIGEEWRDVPGPEATS